MIVSSTRRGLPLLLGVWLLAAAACSSPPPQRQAVDDDSAGSAAPSTPSSTTSPTNPPSEGAPGGTPGGDPSSGPIVEADPDAYTGRLLDGGAVVERLGSLPGKLAIGAGPTLAVARPDGGARQPLGQEGERSAQPTWSPGGTALAWSSVSPARQVVLVQAFGDEDGRPAGAAEISDAEGFPVFYLEWDGGGEHLAYLRASTSPGLVEFGLVRPGRPAEPLDDGAPFFIAWGPGPPRLLTHVDEAVLQLHDADPADDPADDPAEGPSGDGPGPVTVLDRGGGYSAPAWIDDRRAVVVDDGALVVLDVIDGTVEPITAVDGPIAFVLSPDGRRVAYRHLPDRADGTIEASQRGAQGEAPPGGELLVVDVVSGQREVVTTSEAVAWEWSPDGTRLAWLSVELDQRILGRWSFWSVDGSEPGTTRTPTFGLTRVYVEAYLPFFAQYTNSVTGWAPDSSAFAFAGRVGPDPGVWIQLVDAAAGARRVADGDVVTWGPGATPDVSAGASSA